MRPALTRVAAAIAMLAGALLPVGVAAAAPAQSSCVGLIVDPGKGASTSCIPYKAGLTGQQVLQQAGHKLTFAKSGLLCQIDGYPAACKSDNTHYWSYYLRKSGAAPTAWDYATKGPGTQQTAAGETDAFVYVNGTDRKPSAVPYATLAAPKASPSPAAKSSPAAAKSSSDGGGSPTGLIIGIVIAVLIVAAAAGTVLRRRRTS